MGCMKHYDELAQLPQPQIKAALSLESDKKLCWASVYTNIHENVKPTAKAEIERRGLGDCSKDHIKCRSFGYSFPSETFANCRLELEKARRSRPQIITPRTRSTYPSTPSSIYPQKRLDEVEQQQKRIIEGLRQDCILARGVYSGGRCIR